MRYPRLGFFTDVAMLQRSGTWRKQILQRSASLPTSSVSTTLVESWGRGKAWSKRKEVAEAGPALNSFYWLCSSLAHQCASFSAREGKKGVHIYFSLPTPAAKGTFG